MSDTMEKAMIEAMAVQMMLDMCGLNDPEALEAFEEGAEALAKKLTSVALYGATSADVGDEEATYELVDLAQASFALDMAASAMKEHLEAKMAEAAAKQALKELLGALTGDSDGGSIFGVKTNVA